MHDLPPFDTSDAVVIGRTLQLEPTGVATLYAIDRVLRVMVAENSFGDWAVGGPVALHGVYLRDRRFHRVPDELTIIPATAAADPGAHELRATAIVAAIAPTLPDGTLLGTDPGDADLHRIRYTGPEGPETIFVRTERVGRMVGVRPEIAGDPVAKGAAFHDRGAIADPRLPYRGWVARPIPDQRRGEQGILPLVRAEEVLIRTIVAIANRNRTDTAARVDDLRLLVAVAPREAEAMIRTTIRPWLDSVANTADRRLRFIVQLREAIARAIDPRDLPAHLRPRDGDYDPMAARTAIESLIGGLS